MHLGYVSSWFFFILFFSYYQNISSHQWVLTPAQNTWSLSKPTHLEMYLCSPTNHFVLRLPSSSTHLWLPNVCFCWSSYGSFSCSFSFLFLMAVPSYPPHSTDALNHLQNKNLICFIRLAKFFSNCPFIPSTRASYFVPKRKAGVSYFGLSILRWMGRRTNIANPHQPNFHDFLNHPWTHTKQ